MFDEVRVQGLGYGIQEQLTGAWHKRKPTTTHSIYKTRGRGEGGGSSWHACKGVVAGSLHANMFTSFWTSWCMRQPYT